MGSCTRRHYLLSICFLQMLAIVERQVFDFLGYMWAPILANFFHMIFVIFGFYGAYHFRVKYIIAYLIWNFIWIGWNSFLICFYLDIGILNKDSDILNLGTGSVSWFEVNGIGCKPVYPINITSEDPYRPVRPEYVQDCLVEYPIVEVIHSGIQCILSVLAILGAILIAYLFLDEDDQLRKNSKKNKRQSLYTIEFGPPVDTVRGRPDILGYDDLGDRSGQLSPKPMTPRRVKRRSVMTRGTTGRQSTTSRRSTSSSGSHHPHHHQHQHHQHSRSSTRSSRRKYHQSPVTKILDQQQQHQQLQLHQQQQQHASIGPTRQFASFTNVDNPKLTTTNLKNFENDFLASSSGINNNCYVSSTAARNYSATVQSNSNAPYQTSASINVNKPDPIYYNMMNMNTNLPQQNQQLQQQHQSSEIPPQRPQPQHYQQQQQQQQQQAQHSQQPQQSQQSQQFQVNQSSPATQYQPACWSPSTISPGGGHYNPSYQHSNSNLNASVENIDELYNNRPPSVRSSYSNFHGTRPLSSYNPTVSTTENVFVGITGGTGSGAISSGINTTSNNLKGGNAINQVIGTQIGNICTQRTSSTSPVCQPQLPSRRSASRESVRSMAILNGPPPAYNLNYHTPPDSETTM